MGIKRKIITLIFISVLITGLGTGLVGRVLAHNIISNDTNKQLSAIALSTGEGIEYILESYGKQSESLAGKLESHYRTQEPSEVGNSLENLEFIDAIFQQIMEYDDSITEVLLLDANGSVVASTTTVKNDVADYSLDDFYLKGRYNTFVGETRSAQQIDDFSLCAATPVDITGTSYGIVALFYEWDDLDAIIAGNTSLGETGEIYLINGNGNKLTPSNHTDSDMISAQHNLTNSEWSVVVEKESHEVFASLNTFTYIMLGSLGICLLIGILVAFLVAKWITKPFQKLKSDVDIIVNGNLDHIVWTVRKDEIGQLANAIDRMREQILNSRRQISANSTDLREEVRRRTAVLSIANEELKAAREELEERVQDRTAKLIDANDKLQNEIIEHMGARKAIAASLREKEVLIKEVHHRVKNNLQVISSLFSIQSRRATSEEAQSIFRESQNQIRTMALVHEKLYQSDDLATIHFGEYIKNLVNHLFQTFGSSARRIKLKIHADDTYMDINKAIPCGLIVNELLSNSLKHAFPGNARGEIWILFCSNANSRATLIYGDNGAGFPEGSDFRNSKSLGLHLVNTLVGQLDGTIVLDTSRGTEFVIDVITGTDQTEETSSDIDVKTANR